LVAALDGVPIRAVLGLFEGVVTGAADGYARIAGRPALTLSHLGPGLANGLANLHNAARARSPVVNLVGEHPEWHRRLDPPLACDIACLASPMSQWVRTARRSDRLAKDALAALSQALRGAGRVATLIVPADCQWGPADEPPPANPMAREPGRVDGRAIRRAATTLRRGRAALLLGGHGLRRRGLAAAARITAACSTPLYIESFPARLDHGADAPMITRIPYVTARARAVLEQHQALVVAGCTPPVPYFAEPEAERVVTNRLAVTIAASPDDDVPAALEALAEELGAKPASVPARAPARPDGNTLSVPNLMATVASLQPEGAIIVDEGVSAGGAYLAATAGSPPFSYLSLTGGATGFGLPCATGAAIAAPGRRVIVLEGDGSAMYTPQALWTQAREQLDVTTILLANDRYAILEIELARAGAALGDAARRLTQLAPPASEWTALCHAFGVRCTTVATVEELRAALTASLLEPGPNVIEVRSGPRQTQEWLTPEIFHK
jgi:acetolactate synthase-1/2/3 large subunit